MEAYFYHPRRKICRRRKVASVLERPQFETCHSGGEASSSCFVAACNRKLIPNYGTCFRSSKMHCAQIKR